GVGMSGTVFVNPAQAAPAPTAPMAPAPAAPTARKAPAAAKPAATKAPAGAALAATATTAPATVGSRHAPSNLPTTGQGDMNMLLLGIAIIALGAGTVLNRSARRRSKSR